MPDFMAAPPADEFVDAAYAALRAELVEIGQIRSRDAESAA
jgi:hypothetical protein